jgi:phosphoserine phosphatase RsbU/P
MEQILIVEDDNIDRKLLETYVNGMGYEVVSTHNGREAWELLNRNGNTPQIAIIDWLMPEMDGIALCHKIREKAHSNYIYIILVTAKNMSQDIIFGLDAGADDYLTKPYDKGELIARINVGARIVKLEREKNQQLQKIGHTNFKLQQNMKAAARVQLGLLPTRNLKFKDYRFNWYFRPSDHLAGDMLHIYQLTEHKIACYVLDVSGHGTEAALLSVAIRNQLTASLNHHSDLSASSGLVSFEGGEEPNPLDIIKELAQHYEDLLDRTEQYFTIVYGVLDTQVNTFSYVCAGHQNPIWLSNSEIVDNKVEGGTPIGMFKNQSYKQHELQLSPGDRLYLYTDGMIEAKDSSGEQFGLKRLNQRIQSVEDQNTSLENIISDFKDWAGQTELTDDIALIEIICP